MQKLKKVVEYIIFNVKWLLIPFYIKLVVTLVKLLYIFWIHGELTTHELVSTLEDVDIVMIANLIKMIITGSYNSFVDKSHGVEGENVSSGMLKVKMSSSLLGVSSIHLLQVFLNSTDTNWESFWKQIVIHGIFIIGALVLAYMERLHSKCEVDEAKVHNQNNHKGHEKISVSTDAVTQH